MKNLASSLLLIVLTSASSETLAQSATYNWTVQNQFSANGAPVKTLDPSTCSGMTCPVLSPSTVTQGGQATAMSTVTGQNAVGDVYIGYSGNGNTDECDFAIGGGSFNADGTCNAPHAFAYTTKRSGLSGHVQPGCVVMSQPAPTPRGGVCNYTAVFAITTYQ